MVSALASSIDIRDAMLRAEPLLLSRILSEAVEAQSTKNRYINAAVAILQHSLPDDIPLPATAQTLLVQLFQEAAASPRRNTISCVHSLLSGGCKPLLGLLSTDVLKQFEEHVFTILRDATNVEQQSLGLYCLSIMRLLVEGSGSKRDSMRSFFYGVKAHKTLQLVVLRVIWTCKSDDLEASDEILTSIRLALHVLGGVERSVRLDWCGRNTSIVRKLFEKSLNNGLSAIIKFQVGASS